MQCPFCKHPDTRVVDSRVARDGQTIRRRRTCDSCEKRFTTYERVEELLPAVIKRDGSRQPFERGKILKGVQRASQKRSISLDDIEALVDRVERKFAESTVREVTASEIGATVLEELKSLDEVAYVRFASVYHDFRDARHFADELKRLLAGSDGG